MRWMKGMAVTAMVAAMWGCVDNESSFFIEHAKVVPDAPDCTVSSGDEEAAAYALNLFNAVTPGTFFYVTNAIMSQQDYGTLKAESNGIIVDGYELYTLIPGAGAVGGTEYFEYNSYLDPESSDILYADIMSATTIEALRTSFNCNYYTPGQIADAIMTGNMAVYNQLVSEQMPDTMYAVVRFMGHTQGGKNVETQEFSIKIHTYCGVDGGWEPCFASPCAAFCDQTAIYPAACNSGLNQPMRCQDYLDAEYYVEVTEVDETGQTVTVSRPYCSEFCSE